jgi:hypothetical protein
MSAPESKKQTPDVETYVAKMAMRSLGCNPKAILGKPEGDDTPLLLCQIFGKATDLKMGEDKRNGNLWTALMGDFKGRNIQPGSAMEGVVFRSALLFLPGGIQEIVEDQVNTIRKLREDGKNVDSLFVEFALSIQAVKAPNAAGYSYQARNLIPMQAKDVLQELEDFVLRGIPRTTIKYELPAQRQAALPAPSSEIPTPLAKSNAAATKGKK